jgi:hypothetical protein
MAVSDNIPIPYLRECFDYDPATGIVRWRERPPQHFITSSWSAARWNQNFAGQEAGSRDPNGYRVVTLTFESKMLRLYQHRLAWALTHGAWPKNLDHYDGDPANNRIGNLFEADYSDNAQNRTNMKFAKGAYPWPNGGWRANIRVNGEYIYLGTYATEQEAHQVYLDAKKKYHQYRPIPRD